MISDLWNKSLFSIIKEHIFENRDDSNSPLNMLEKLNVKIDTLAKNYSNKSN